jgi:hypothetical protein
MLAGVWSHARARGGLGLVAALAIACGGQTERAADHGVAGPSGGSQSAVPAVGGDSGTGGRGGSGGSSDAAGGEGELGGTVGLGGSTNGTGGETGTGGLGGAGATLAQFCYGQYIEQVDGPPADDSQLSGLNLTVHDVASSSLVSFHYAAGSDPSRLASPDEAGVVLQYDCGNAIGFSVELLTGGSTADPAFLDLRFDPDCTLRGTYVDATGSGHSLNGTATAEMRLQSLTFSDQPNPDLIAGTLSVTMTDDSLRLLADFELRVARFALGCI